MKNYFLIVFCLLNSTAFGAMYPYQSTGSSTVLGGYSNRHSLISSSGNPASSYLMMTDNKFRTGFISPVGVALEGGGISDLNSNIDSLVSAINNTNFVGDFNVSSLATDAAASSDPDQYIADAISTEVNDIDSSISDVNSIVSDVADTTYVKLSTVFQAPFTPIIYKTDNSQVFTLDTSASLVGRVGILADDITISGLDDLKAVTSVSELSSLDTSNFGNVSTDTSVYIKTAFGYRLGLGYSGMFYSSSNAALIVGGRLNYHELSLKRNLTVLLNDDPDLSFDDLLDTGDSMEQGLSLDVGAILVGRNYQIGASVANLNEPSFDYEVLGDCTGLSGSDLTSCNAAVGFSNDGSLSLEEYVMEAQLTLDAALQSSDQKFSVAVSYDVNAIKDPLGDEYQWTTASLAYFSDSNFIPGIRVGFRNNIVGSELSYITAGVTLSKRLDIDIAYANENDDGNSGVLLSVAYNFAS